MRQRQLLPGDPDHARSDGGVPDRDVRSADPDAVKQPGDEEGSDIDPVWRNLIDLCLKTGEVAPSEARGEELADFAARLNVEAYLLNGLAGLQGRLGPVQTAWLATLRRRVAESAVANLRRDRAAAEVIARLAGLGIEVILLKGAALRREVPELAGRFECDTDLLVRPEDVTRSRQALAEL
ncbi:MAG TPA: nucleotidyltransferase family protein, partial [Thermoanaerobaculia bacterium]|nr:nucleotidyltransferase family protein [Thermoanaerobaculia bacterium]